MRGLSLSSFLSHFKLKKTHPLPPHLGLEGLGLALSSPGGDPLLLEQGEELRVREGSAVVGQPTGFLFLVFWS